MPSPAHLSYLDGRVIGEFPNILTISAFLKRIFPIVLTGARTRVWVSCAAQLILTEDLAALLLFKSLSMRASYNRPSCVSGNDFKMTRIESACCLLYALALRSKR